uniref:Uncharacterized protein n=1 Tax=Setaria italica TaxID=4555 RepID=K3YXN6_SETIT
MSGVTCCLRFPAVPCPHWPELTSWDSKKAVNRLYMAQWMVVLFVEEHSLI